MALDRYQVHADIPILNLLCVLFVLKTKKGCLLNILKSLFNGLTLAVAALKGRIGNKVPPFFLLLEDDGERSVLHIFTISH